MVSEPPTLGDPTPPRETAETITKTQRWEAARMYHWDSWGPKGPVARAGAGAGTLIGGTGRQPRRLFSQVSMNSKLGTGQGEQRGFLQVTNWVVYLPPTPAPAVTPRPKLLTLISLVLCVTWESFPQPTWGGGGFSRRISGRGGNRYLSLFSGWGK